MGDDKPFECTVTGCGMVGLSDLLLQLCKSTVINVAKNRD